MRLFSQLFETSESPNKLTEGKERAATAIKSSWATDDNE